MVFVITAEATIGPEASECALNQPTLRKWLKAGRFLYSPNNLKEPVKAPPDEAAWRALISAVGEDRLQARDLSENSPQ